MAIDMSKLIKEKTSIKKTNMLKKVKHTSDRCNWKWADILLYIFFAYIIQSLERSYYK